MKAKDASTETSATDDREIQKPVASSTRPRYNTFTSRPADASVGTLPLKLKNAARQKVAMLLALDPSSTTTGYSVFNDARKMVDAGLIKPAKSKEPDSNVRIAQMTQDVLDLAREYKISRVVIEDTSGKVSKRHGGGGAGLSIYGKAIGYMMGALKMKGFEVIPVLENVWTAGRSKASRQAAVAARYRSYRAKDDPGLDMSDAIALGDWYLDRESSAS